MQLIKEPVAVVGHFWSAAGISSRLWVHLQMMCSIDALSRALNGEMVRNDSQLAR